MAIEKKLIHFGKLADFEAQLTAGNILDRSIVFIQDAKKIWTHGTYYDCSEGTAAGDIVQSDWNENDPVSDSYIQGRTHYSYDVEQIALFSIASKNEGDILVTGLYVGGFYKLYNQAGGKSQVFHFVEGRKVPIPSVGPPIEAVCTYEDDYCLKLTTPTYGMNESFSLMEMYVEQLKDIYLPETIARTSELKTINGESILGSGDITISGGGSGEDIRYFTEFTVEQVVAAGGWLPLSNGTSELYTVAENNKLICIPCQDGLNGFIVASYEVTLDEELYVSFIYGNVYYRMIVTPLGLDISIQPLLTQTVFVDSGSIDVYDNTNYVVTAPVTSVYITIMGKSNVGSTIRFTTGEDCSLRITGNSIWANGVIPTIESGVTYELSIIRQSIAGSNKVLAVLTPFKSV